MVTKTKKKSGEGEKAKAPKVEIGQLMVTDAWAKTFTSGKTGFFGKAMDSQGNRYQIVAAVRLN